VARMSKPRELPLPPPAAVAPDRHETEIRPAAGRVGFGLAELWRYRELLYFLVWRDVKVRYKQTVLGASWAILQPLVTMIVFSVVFGRLVQVPSDGLPYPVFAFAALVPWTFFSVGLALAANSLVNSQNLLKKVYFPRLVIPIASVLAGLVDFALAFVVLIGLMLVFGIWLSPLAVAVIPLVGLALITCLGVGLWLSALNVRYRDIRHIVPFLVQVWLFATPIAYPASLIDEPWRTVYAVNPMVGVVEGFRWALLGTETAPGPLIAVSTVVAILVLVTGARYFRRSEGTFADVV
jgi:lipopolysaccharide transport system permease protein